MPKNLHMIGGKLRPMTPSAVLDAVAAAERALRTGSFRYVEEHIGREESEEIRAWPDDVRVEMKRRRDALASATSPTHAQVRQIIRDTFASLLVPRRAEARGYRSTEPDMNQMLAEIPLATIFGRAPGLLPGPKEYNGQRMLVHGQRSPGRIAVPVEAIPAADVHVLGIYFPLVNRAWLAGWARQSDLRTCPVGCRRTDQSLPWASMSHYMEYAQLRPMSDLLSENGIKELPEGVLFERLPLVGSLPIQSSLDFGDDEPDARDDFFTVIGIEGDAPVSPGV